LSVFGYCIVVSLTAFSVICNKTFYKVYTLLSHTPHHTKSPLVSRGRDSDFRKSRLRPSTKFEVRRPSHSEDTAHLMCQL